MAGGHVPVTTGSRASRRADVDGFLVTWVRFPPLLKLPLHTHDRATVAVILSGSFHGLMRHSSHPCPLATTITEPPGEVHGNQFEQAGADVLTIQPDPERLELLEPFADVIGEVNYLRDPVVASLASRAARELRVPDQISAFAVEGLVLEMLVLAARQRGSAGIGGDRRPPNWLAEARNLLHDRQPRATADRRSGQRGRRSPGAPGPDLPPALRHASRQLRAPPAADMGGRPAREFG